MTRLALWLAILLLSPVAQAANPCTEDEELGFVVVSPECREHYDLFFKIVEASLPCRLGITAEAWTDLWYGEVERCEAEAHEKVCGQSRCY